MAYLRSTAQCFLYAKHWIIINILKTRTFIQWNNNVVTARLFLVITLYQVLCISFHPQEARALGTSRWRRTPAYVPGGSGASLLLGFDSPTSFIRLFLCLSPRIPSHCLLLRSTRKQGILTKATRHTISHHQAHNIYLFRFLILGTVRFRCASTHVLGSQRSCGFWATPRLVRTEWVIDKHHLSPQVSISEPAASPRVRLSSEDWETKERRWLMIFPVITHHTFFSSYT